MVNDVPRDRLSFPLLPLKNVVVFPRTIVNLTVARSRLIQALNVAVDHDRKLVIVGQKDVDREEPRAEDLYRVGTLVEVKQVRRQVDQSMQVEVEALRRVRLVDVSQQDNCFAVTLEQLPEKNVSGREADATMRHLGELFEQYAALNSRVPQDAAEHIRNARYPGYMADLLAAHLLTDPAERQRLLEMQDQSERLQYMSVALINQLDIMQTEQRVRDKVRSSLDKNQREFYLREQLKAIHDELASDSGSEIDELRERLEKKGLPAEILQRVQKELNRLERMPSISPESAVLRNYVDWIIALPWSERSVDRIDLPLAEEILEEDHYGLSQVKERILDFLAVRQLTLRKSRGERRQGSRGNSTANEDDMPRPQRLNQQTSILCFVGPPGVGKTSLGQSIARAMHRKFVRLSLGGVHDESEVRGHRRTYVGAMPGRIVQAMRTAGTVNPVMLLDEVDKMTADMRGDPAAALLEVLDPAQNYSFTDHYLDVPYDLSDVFFITTANTLYNIPRPLRDRMEVIEISGYTEEEKVQIARRHLLAKQVEAHGLEPGFLEVPDRMLRIIIRTYTREAGVRELDRKLAAICRKAARRVVQGRATRVRVTPHNLEEFLGQPRYRAENEVRRDQVGVAMGLAYTEHGGELLPVEVAAMPGHGALTITGRLGDVMQESARAALSFARSRAGLLQIDLEKLEKCDLHIHVPEGGIPKDGPSAGITMASALISSITGRPVRSDVGMTGEITLTGRVLAIGGFKEKVLAAHRGGMRVVVAPAANKPDLAELPRPVRRDVEFVWVDTMDQVIDTVLLPFESQPAVPVGSVEQNTQPADRPEGDSGGTIINDPNTLPIDAPSVQTSSTTRRAKNRKPKGDSPASEMGAYLQEL